MGKTTNFVILGTQRTGTTLIRTSLSSHPEIICGGEVFNLGKRPYSNADGYWAYSNQNLKMKVRALLQPATTTADYLDQVYSQSEFAAIGFKLMLNHCVARPYIWRLLKEKDIKAILVWRRNALKTLVSRRTAAKSGVYHVSKTLPAKSAVGSWAGSTVELDVTSLVSDLDAVKLESAKWRSQLDNLIEYIDVAYEDYVEDTIGGNRKLLGFLGVPQHALTSDLKKVNPDALSDLICNYDEVAETLKNTEYSIYLADT